VISAIKSSNPARLNCFINTNINLKVKKLTRLNFKKNSPKVSGTFLQKQPF